MTLAKALGGGLPIGVTLLRQRVADAITAGDHAATFGANPVACAVASKVFDKITEEGFVDGVRQKGEYITARLTKLQERWPDHITGVRGRGLLVGAVTTRPSADYLVPFRERDILVATAGPDVVRFLPPLIAEQDHIDEVIDVFDEILRQGLD